MTTAALAVAVNWLSSRIVENLVDRRFQTIAESAAAQVSGLIDTAKAWDGIDNFAEI
jgi:hypothetical protein